MIPQTQILALPMELLRRRRSETIQILRLGAAVNAIVSMLRASHAFGDPRKDVATSEAAARRKEIDRVHVLVAAVAYVTEAIRVLEDGDTLWRLVKRGHGMATDVGWSFEEGQGELRTLGRDLCKPLRDVIGFHFGASAFDSWLNKWPRTHAALWVADGPALPQQVFRASADAMALEMERLTLTDGQRVDMLFKAHALLAQMAYLAIAGLVAELGLNWDECIRLK